MNDAPISAARPVDARRVEAVLARQEAGFAKSVGRLEDFLRIPSISAQPDHAQDCVAAAEWAAARLREIGFSARVAPTAGHPVVVAHHPGPGAEGGHTAPHYLYYGHYDVQPPEPLSLWTHPPFEPTRVAGPHGERLYARGAVDDKGQSMMWLEAFRAWQEETGGLPVAVTVLLEGEEEIGSPSLNAFIAENRAELSADAVVVSDTGMWDVDTPALTTRLRGMVYAEIRLKAATRDLHSGMYGGSALNPINAITHIVGDLADGQGRIRIPGFYDGVEELPPALAAQWKSLGFDEDRFLGDIGLDHHVGEHGRPPLERMWSRPTADLNGIWGGYDGPGSKTVIAAEAGAKLSCRLVPGQDPAKIADGIRAFVAERAPPGAKVEVEIFSGTPAIVMAEQSPLITAGVAALAAEYGREPLLIGCGGSIPVVSGFRDILGCDSLLMGFGLDDDQVHSPNEKFEMTCFRKGMRSHVRLLGALAGK